MDPISEQDVPLTRSADIGGAERELNRLEHTTALTHEGREWFVVACDPFHDKALFVDGYPDYDSSNSIVQVVKRSFTIKAPFDVIATGANWDCNVFSLPILQQDGTAGNTGVLSPPYFGNPTGSFVPILGTINAYGAPAGNATWITPAGLTPPNAGQQSFGAVSPVNGDAGSPPIYDSFYTDGRTRLIGCAFEVINNTALINAQGTVTPYRQSSDPIHIGPLQLQADVFAPVPTAQVYDSYIIKGPPPFLDQAILLPDSTQFHAREGCYCVLSQAGQHNPFQQPNYTALAIGSRDLTMSGTQVAAVRRGALTVVPFNMSGAYFSGLSATTTLTINARFIMERAPTQTESDLLVMARPSPMADEVAWRLYTAAMRQVVPGVRLRDNALGSWFRSAVSSVGKALAPVAKVALPMLKEAVLSHPKARAVRGLLGAVPDIEEAHAPLEAARTARRKRKAPAPTRR